MMALRHAAARRLAGCMALRAQAAVADERRRLVHTDESARKQVWLKIQQKKEELYDAISRAENELLITDGWNRKLAQDLSVQITPRPYDNNWRRWRIMKRVKSVVKIAGLLSLSSGIQIASVFVQWPGEEEEKVPQHVLTSKSSRDII